MSLSNIAFDRHASIGTVNALHFGNKHTEQLKFEYLVDNLILGE